MKNISVQTTAIYCRVACKDDVALENQELSLKRYENENGYGNVKLYSDNGFGGSNLCNV
jgi:DNA invertase Pin-like site-specific DNA recombinase